MTRREVLVYLDAFKTAVDNGWRMQGGGHVV